MKTNHTLGKEENAYKRDLGFLVLGILFGIAICYGTYGIFVNHNKICAEQISINFGECNYSNHIFENYPRPVPEFDCNLTTKLCQITGYKIIEERGK
jgi:hypothetical protein